MRSNPGTSLGCLLLAAAALSRGGGTGQDVAVAVCDLGRVLEEGKPFVEERARIAAWIDEQKRTNLEVRRDALEKHEAELDLYEPGSEERRRREDELAHERLSFEQELARLDRERRARITAAQRAAWEKARSAIAEAAAARGVRLVLQLRPRELEGETEERLSAEIWSRDVLWHDPSLDITPDVLRILGASH